MDARDTDFLTAITTTTLVGDGAMGTYLHQRSGLPLDRCFPEQNLSDPRLVESVHAEYFAAGSHVLRTNTYGAHRIGLNAHGLQDSTRKINIHGARLARQASEHRAWILGCIGPLGRPLEPVGRISLDAARAAFEEQAACLAEGGVDAIVIETIADMVEMEAAVTGVRAACDLPIIAQKTFTEDGMTLMGQFPGEVVQALTELGVDVIGANCSLGPHAYLAILERMALVADQPLSVFPTAGIPVRDRNSVRYDAAPSYLAEHAVRFARLGVRLIGGCCGFTPTDIAAVAAALAAADLSSPSDTESISRVTRIESAREPQELTDRSALSRKLGRELVVTVEMDIPRGHDMETLIEGSRYLKEHGVDAVNITDGARARLRLHPMVICHQIEEQVGIESIMHYACRDRNVLGMQSEILGAAALGLRNILIVSGDPTAIGDYPKATSVFEVDSSGLTRVVTGMNAGRDMAGNRIGRPTSFYIAVGANPMAENMNEEIERLRRKADAGAHCVYTQPIFELGTLERFLEQIADLHLPVALGVLPLRTARHAEFLHNEVPGIDIPADIRARMVASAGGEDGDAAAREAAKRAQAEMGVEVAVELVERAKSMVAGIYLMPPFKRYEMVPAIMAGAGISRPGVNTAT
jgi:homocysteine S-methyltransferase